MMEVEFLSSFNKDISRIRLASVRKALQKIILSAEEANSLSDLKNVKKLTGFSDAYRIRMGDYRIGLFYTGKKIIFARVVHRKDIYKVFP